MNTALRYIFLSLLSIYTSMLYFKKYPNSGFIEFILVGSVAGGFLYSINYFFKAK